MVRVDALNITDLHPNGFKILLEILVRNPKLIKAEVPFSFGERHAGESKASTKEALNYFKLLWTLKFNPPRYVLLGLLWWVPVAYWSIPSCYI